MNSYTFSRILSTRVDGSSSSSSSAEPSASFSIGRLTWKVSSANFLASASSWPTKMLSTARCEREQGLELTGSGPLTQDVLGHGPELDSDTGELGEVRRGLVLEERWVGDLARGPDALVLGVGDLGNGPLALQSMSAEPGARI
jgi:hypothetical protein